MTKLGRMLLVLVMAWLVGSLLLLAVGCTEPEAPRVTPCDCYGLDSLR